MTIWIRNAKIATMDEEQPLAESAVVIGQFFAYVGTESGAKQFLKEHPQDEIEELDCGGHFITPGFNDSHMHYLHYIKAKTGSADLTGCTSVQELLTRMKARFEQNFDPDSELWLSGEGWNHDYFTDEKRYPTAKELDTITTEYPIIIMRACFHIAVLNSKGLELMGINRDTVKAYGDYAETYPDGEPNGVIKEQVLDAVKVKLGAPSLSRLLDLMLEHQTDLFEQGITSIQSDDFKYSPEGKAYDLMELLRAASEDGRLKVRYAEQVQLPTKQEINQFFEEKRFGHFSGGPGFRLACVKILSDGSLGARTALMRKPYADAPSVKGIGIYETQEELDELVSIAHRNNMPVAIHAIGDGAIERCLDAIERAQRSMPYLHPRHGIVHCQITDRALLQRFRDLDVIAFIQPIFIDYDRKIVFDRVGSELGRTSYAWRDLIESGVHAPFGTDCPVESFRPMPGLYCAVSRCGLEGGEPFLPQQRLTREQALFGYTAAGAYSTGDETIKGEIRGGMLADFVIFDTDLLTCSERAILDAKVLSTYIGGECVYREK